MENQEFVDEIKDTDLDEVNPHVAEAIRAIQAEREGTAEIEWSDFSSHNQTISASASK